MREVSAVALPQRGGARHKVLLERRVLRDEERDGRPPRAAGAAHLLAERRDRPRVPEVDRRVQVADVHTELQSVRRDDAQELAARERALDLPSLVGAVAGAVTREALLERGIVDEVARALEEELGERARADEGEGAACRCGEGCALSGAPLP